MKKMPLLFVFVVVLLLDVAVAAASGGQQPSLARGRALFQDPSLAGSTNPRSCAGCHPHGQGLEYAAGNPELPRVINRCIIGPLGGKPLDPRSVEMGSLVEYVRSLAR